MISMAIWGSRRALQGAWPLFPEPSRVIVSASYRTDIPTFYGRWFARRLQAGFCRVSNPYGCAPSIVRLDRDPVDGFVFWTRNLGPFRPVLETVAARDTPFIVQYTITGYSQALEAAMTAPETAIGQLRNLARDFGPARAVWRYGPVIDTALTPLPWHEENFARLAGALAGTVDEVVVSFTHIYKKTKANTDAAARRHGFSWRDPPRTKSAPPSPVSPGSLGSPPATAWPCRPAPSPSFWLIFRPVCPLTRSGRRVASMRREKRATGRAAPAPNRAISAPMTAAPMAACIAMRCAIAAGCAKPIRPTTRPASSYCNPIICGGLGPPRHPIRSERPADQAVSSMASPGSPASPDAFGFAPVSLSAMSGAAAAGPLLATPTIAARSRRSCSM
jgi:hypothetical protein